MSEFITITDKQRECSSIMAKIWENHANVLLDEKLLKKAMQADMALEKAINIYSALNFFNHGKGTQEHYDVVAAAVTDLQEYMKKNNE